MVSLSQVRDQVRGFLGHEISLGDLAIWLARESWNLDKGADVLTQQLVYATQSRIAEYDQEHLSEEELREMFRALVNAYQPVSILQKTSISRTVEYRNGSIIEPVAVPPSSQVQVFSIRR
jgi:hypothetical protein